MYTLEVCFSTITSCPTFGHSITAFKLIIIEGVITSVINTHFLVGIFPVINQIILVKALSSVRVFGLTAIVVFDLEFPKTGA